MVITNRTTRVDMIFIESQTDKCTKSSKILSFAASALKFQLLQWNVTIVELFIAKDVFLDGRKVVQCSALDN